MASLYHYMDCPYCFRVRMYAHERSIKFENVVVERGSPPPELPSLNPLLRLPVWINDENKPIFGSNTIIDYLEHSDPDEPLVPTESLPRARVWMADELARDGLLEPLIALDRDLGGRDPDNWNLSLYKKKTARIRRTLNVFEALLGGRKWLIGDDFTLADLSLALPLSILERYGIDLADTPALADLAERLAARDSMRLARMRNP